MWWCSFFICHMNHVWAAQSMNDLGFLGGCDCWCCQSQCIGAISDPPSTLGHCVMCCPKFHPNSTQSVTAGGPAPPPPQPLLSLQWKVGHVEDTSVGTVALPKSVLTTWMCLTIHSRAAMPSILVSGASAPHSEGCLHQSHPIQSMTCSMAAASANWTQ